MEHGLTKLLLLALTLGGCSKLYDPDHLPAATDAPRPPPDVQPCAMEVTDLAPVNVFEGTGVGGSLPAVLVISGKNLVKQNTIVTIAAAAGMTRTPMLQIDGDSLEVGSYGEHLAVQIRIPVDDTLPAGESITLDVTVAQDCIEGQKTGTIPGRLTLRGLDELKDQPTVTLAGEVREYSEIKITPDTNAIAIDPNATKPIVLRSRSSVEIRPQISVSAPGRIGGPGGGTGGAGGNQDLLNPGPGMAGTGPSPGLPSGGAAGFSNSDVGLTTLDAPNRGSGGAGGDGTTLAPGRAGGGGGGSIEITAAGHLTVGNISARGAPPATTPGGGNPGGGGSGGVILLRAGGDLISGTIDVAGGGQGASGLARHDAGGLAMGGITSHYRGPMFVTPPLITTSRTPEITISGKPSSSFRYFVIRESSTSMLVETAIGAGGTARLTLETELQPGLSELCLVPSPGAASSETRNCIPIAYLE